MKLYYAIGSCGLAPQIALREAEQTFDLVKVDFQTKTTVEGDYFKVTPKGFVPALKLADGDVITEGAVVLQWIADNNPERKLLPAPGSPQRYRALEWLNYIATDMHKGYATLFSPFLDDASKARFIEGNLSTRFEYLDGHLSGSDYLLETGFSVADAYLYNVLTWSPRVNIDLSPYAAIQRFMMRMGKRPSVLASLEAEGISLS
ncbi:glutathione transferase GstA [Rhizobium sp. P38BS-XIX]|uniref:glutathione transferase GstA n=1 Tax=Rhizobium sp. P38BS-XIX TaxID=2726740 RepID=UPI0014572653|nr:glutathione transferase GstA [Rhizobium sp. P38BS-XIX]NLS01558.1 glutathione transferase GstA [Rhizobium sp. P38BS-XIX]